MTEQTRNQHKNTMKTRPLGQSSLLQFSGRKMPENEESETCNICGVELYVHNNEICQMEYNN